MLHQEQSEYTLSQANSMVARAVEKSLPQPIWVQAEILNMSVRNHCYMELVEKDELSNTPIAQSRACCWSNTWQKVSSYFMHETGEPLHVGMKVLLMVRANFHEAYGFSWVVMAIDPNYTLGDMKRRRMMILQSLKEQGILDLNKTLPIPLFAKRIAVISSATAAGYGDFCNQLVNNNFGYPFYTRLYQSVMQGNQVEESIIAALERIYEDADNFDVVVIIRGGGSTADLSGFDTQALAENVANFPLPIITGIGHERDNTILDVVSCVSLKTPTAVAAFLIDRLHKVDTVLDDCSEQLGRTVKVLVEKESLKLSRIEQLILTAFTMKKMREENKWAELRRRMYNAVANKMLAQKNRLQMLEQSAKFHDPVNILRKGYSITLHNGYAVTDQTKVKDNDEVTIMLATGQLSAIVKK